MQEHTLSTALRVHREYSLIFDMHCSKTRYLSGKNEFEVTVLG